MSTTELFERKGGGEALEVTLSLNDIRLEVNKIGDMAEKWSEQSFDKTRGEVIRRLRESGVLDPRWPPKFPQLWPPQIPPP